MNPIDNVSVRQLKTVKSNISALKDDIILSCNMEYTENLFDTPRRLDAFAVMLCVSGEADIQINLNKYRMFSGTLIFSIPENIIQIMNVSNLRVHPIIISSDFFKKININIRDMMSLYMFAKNRPLIRLDYSDICLLDKYYFLIENIIEGEDIQKESMLEGVIYSLFFKLESIVKKRDESGDISIRTKERSEEIFEKFMEQLTRYHNKERNLSFYADKMNITSNYLSKLVKDYSGKTAAEWINEYIILEAKILIKHSQFTIQEIAYKLNFPTPSFFGKYFKRLTGMTPKQYKVS